MCEQLFPHLTDPAPVVVIKVGIEDSETAVALRSVPGPFVFPGKSCDRRVVSFPPVIVIVIVIVVSFPPAKQTN